MLGKSGIKVSSRAWSRATRQPYQCFLLAIGPEGQEGQTVGGRVDGEERLDESEVAAE